jgi:DNA-directed RNA polymerase subunit RPC12/RpoP
MDVMPNSGIKVWWKCSKGHEWNATINHRNQGHGCPYCAGQKVLKGYNDLQTANPDLAKEWNYEKNGNLTPEIFTANSGIKVWWRCAKNHEWQAIIANRNRGRGCPYCSGRKK